MNANEQRIIDEVDRREGDFIAFLRELVMTPSMTGQEDAVARKLYDGLKKRGMEDVRIVEKTPGRPNVLAYCHGVEDGPNFIFNGHLDVLPPQNELAWQHPPFGGDIEGDTLYGRGTVDMKSGTFSSFFAGIVLNALKIPIRGNVLFTGVCDELISGDKGIIYLIDEGYIQKRHEDDCGLNCEPTDMREINISTKGILRADVEIQGKGAFNARPYLGISAIDKSVKFITAIQELDRQLGADPSHKHRLLGPRTVQVAMIEGGEASNLVPDHVKMTVTRRLHPGETQQGCMDDYQRIIDKLHAEDPDFAAKCAPWPGFRPPAEVDEDAPVVRAAARAHKLIRGEEVMLTGSEGGTDASHVVARTGIPMPVYGPGDYKLLGTMDECINLKDFLDAVKIYALTVCYLLGLN